MSSYEQGSFALGTWIEHGNFGVTPAIEEESNCDYSDVVQFIVEGSRYEVLTHYGGRFVILDDHEVSDNDSIHDWRDEQIQKEHEG
jgi:hypothetical protein